MKRLLVLAFFLPILHRAIADLVVGQRIEETGQTGTTATLRLKGNKLRVDLETPTGPVSSVMDLDTGDSVRLMHDQKVMTRLSGAQAKETIDFLRKEAGKKTETRSGKPEAAGRKERIGEFLTEVFTWNGANGVQTIWVTKELPNYAKVKEQFDRISKSASPELTSLPGVVVKTEVEREGKKFTATVLSVKEEEQNPALFEPPPDYRESEKRVKPNTAPPAEPAPTQ